MFSNNIYTFFQNIRIIYYYFDIELAGNEANDNRIIPQHLQSAIHNDEELNKLTIAQGGVFTKACCQRKLRKVSL